MGRYQISTCFQLFSATPYLAPNCKPNPACKLICSSLVHCCMPRQKRRRILFLYIYADLPLYTLCCSVCSDTFMMIVFFIQAGNNSKPLRRMKLGFFANWPFYSLLPPPSPVCQHFTWAYTP